MRHLFRVIVGITANESIHKSARSRRTLLLPLVRECEVQTEKISQSDVKAVQDIEIHTKAESRVEFPKKSSRERENCQ